MAKSSRLKALDGALKSFEKDYKIEIRDKSIKKVPRWQLDVPYLDELFGGGLAQSRIYEFFGGESGGKTAISLFIASVLQKKYDAHITFIDAEQALDVSFYQKSFGLLTDEDHWFYFQPDYGEQALAFAHRIMNSGATDLIIVDSVSALTPKAEAEGEIGDSFMGLQARMMGQGLRKITSDIKKNPASILFINQIRMKIGVMYGDPSCVSPDTLVDVIFEGS